MRKRIGIIGDGQLAKMLIESSNESYEFGVYGTDPDGPCRNIADHHHGSLTNFMSLQRFCDLYDVVTFENEFFDIELLKSIDANFFPSLDSLVLIENKIVEKQTAKEAGLVLGDYIVIEDIINYDFKKPVVIKVPKGGYDGYGTFIIKSSLELKKAKDKLVQIDQQLIIEDLVPFEKELAITASRNKKGEFCIYPLVESVQKNAICVRVEAPCRLSNAVQRQAEEYIKAFMDKIKYVGVMSLEFFYTKEGVLLFNESAPRPHNSAHYTMDQYNKCQFQLHLDSILDKSYEELRPKYPFCVMINLLGNTEGPPLWKTPEVNSPYKIHNYNKPVSRAGRKMGHLNLPGSDIDLIIEDSKRLAKEFTI